ncbi:MAG: hypothetical protein KF699_15230, partial [Phycisphaeraceae bacterium]|nr:hypothetical protein [Phycisphaeraceae bacterium]
PGCTQSTDCEVADWCGDAWVGVEDLFCFLEEWFGSTESDAYNFGGTPGVPAIFAYLTMWFTVGIGPCDP